MYFSMMAGLALAAAGTPANGALIHEAMIDHRGAPVRVIYRAGIDVTTRQIGMAAGTRMSNERCMWTARVDVWREAGRSESTLTRAEIDADKILRGSRPGPCHAAQPGIARDVAARHDAVRAHLVTVAEQDRDRLLATLDAAGPLAAN